MKVTGDRILQLSKATALQDGQNLIVVGEPVAETISPEQISALHNAFILDYEPVELYDYLPKGLDIKLAEFPDGKNRSLLQQDVVDARFVDFLNKEYDNLPKADQALYHAFQHGFSELQPYTLVIQEHAQADYRGAYQAKKPPRAYLDTLLKTPAYKDAFEQMKKDYPQQSEKAAEQLFFARARRVLRDQIARPSGTDMREVLGIQETAYGGTARNTVGLAAVLLLLVSTSVYYASASSNFADGHDKGFDEGQTTGLKVGYEEGHDDGAKLNDDLLSLFEISEEDLISGKYRNKSFEELLKELENDSQRDFVRKLYAGLVDKIKKTDGIELTKDNTIITLTAARGINVPPHYIVAQVPKGPFAGKNHLMISSAALLNAYYKVNENKGLSVDNVVLVSGINKWQKPRF